MGRDGDRIDIIPVSDHEASLSAANDALWQAIEESLWEETGVRRPLPILTPAATDARFFRARGAAAYGVGLFDDRVSFSEFMSLFHGHDERVSVRSVERTTDLIERVVARFGEFAA
jgi:acetylornithine deacetylase/succinyl-diaminopimelate desuccinylase-like protein